MNIKDDIQRALDRLKWTPNRLAKESGVPQCVISRVLSGTRQGVHSTTLQKLWPYLYENKQKEQ